MTQEYPKFNTTINDIEFKIVYKTFFLLADYDINDWHG